MQLAAFQYSNNVHLSFSLTPICPLLDPNINDDTAPYGVGFMDLDLELLITFAALAIAIVFGWLTWTAKHIWRNRKITQRYAMIAIIATIIFMVLVYLQ